MKISLFRGLSPQKADVAFASIDAKGTQGFLNDYVMAEMAYSPRRLESPAFLKDLNVQGFARMWEKGSNPIIFIVTLGGTRKVAPHLGRNLAAAFEAYAEDLKGKNLWIPLMGTGAAGLSYTESMEMTLEAIGTIPEDVQPASVQISLPADIDEETVLLLTGLLDSDDSVDLDALLSSFNGTFYAVGSSWGSSGDQIERFIENNIWESGDDERGYEMIQSVQPGDVFLLKSTFAHEGEAIFRLKAIGIVTGKSEDTLHLKVDWIWHIGKLDIPGNLGRLRHRISRLTAEDFQTIANHLGRKRTVWRSIFTNSGAAVSGKAPSGESPSHWWWNTRLGNIEPGSMVPGRDFGLRVRPDDVNFENLAKVEFGHKLLGYEPREMDAVLWVLEVVANKSNSEEGILIVKVLSRLSKPLPFAQIRVLPEMQYSPVLTQPSIDFHPLTEAQFDAILHLGSSQVDELALIPESKIAPVLSDTDEGDDYFEIQKDVEAFAKVIAARSFTPPLAIALFGKWGTGKSFFMNKLKQKIQSLSKAEKEKENPIYCTGVVHIQFNAWSYLDANLWASIVTKIFDGLNEYINQNTASEKEKAAIEQTLQNELSIIQEERKVIEAKKLSAEIKRSELRTEIASKRTILQGEIDAIKFKTWEKVLESIDAKFKVRDTLTQALKSNPEVAKLGATLDELVPEVYRHNPDLAMQELKSTRNYLREFMRDRNSQLWLGGGLLVAAIVLLLPALLRDADECINMRFILLPQIALSAMAIIAPLWKAYTKIYDVLKPIIAEVWKVKKDYETQVEAARFAHTQEMEARKLQIELYNQEIDQLDGRIEDLNKVVLELEFKLQHGLATETLYSFIEKRASSEEYKKHLGIVSTIRKDFEVLSKLFKDSLDEQGQQLNEFQKHFTNPLQRIVLYVDDLDRCPENRVIEVLEAVNLLMAFPLFVVVVGVDPRWVKNALLQKYELQFKSPEESAFEVIEASNYLEKIFQVPFHLRQASDKDVKHMLHKLTEKNVRKETNTPASNQDQQSNSSESIPERTTEGEAIFTVDTRKGDTPASNENLALYPDEVKLMQDMSHILGNNPRAIKRFVNVYQIARAHAGLTIGDRQAESFLVLMLLLALPVGPYRELYNDFLDYLERTSKEDIGDFGLYLEGSNLKSGQHKIGFKLAELKAAVEQMESKEILIGFQSKMLADHNDFVQRFTFAELI